MRKFATSIALLLLAADMILDLDRDGPLVRVRLEDQSWSIATDHLSTFDSIMTHISDPQNAPEALMLRESIRGWRFYDQFRTDLDSPVRLPQLGTWTPILGNDGSDLASAILTIRDIGADNQLDAAVSDAFPGSQLCVRDAEGRLTLERANKACCGH